MAPWLLGWKAPVDFVVVCRERAKLTIVFQAGSWGDAAGLEEGGGEVECPGALPALQPSCLPSSQARGKARRRRRRRRGMGWPACSSLPMRLPPLSLFARQLASPKKFQFASPRFFFSWKHLLGKKKKSLKTKFKISPFNCGGGGQRRERDNFKMTLFSWEGISTIYTALPYTWYCTGGGNNFSCLFW